MADCTISSTSLLEGFHSTTITVLSKPNAPIHYAFHPPHSIPPRKSTTFIVFINGLGLPMSGWHAAISHLLANFTATSFPIPAILLYDRFNQGLSRCSDPLDKGKALGYGHNALDVIRDLHELIEHFTAQMKTPTGGLRIMFVAHSIGCALAHLYIQAHPGTIAGLILLDSNMANNDQIDDLWPDPDSLNFSAATNLPVEVSVEDLRKARDAYAKLFSPNAKNAEGFDRRDLATLLPHADAPVLLGPGEKGPLVLVVGHDPVEFARQAALSPILGTPVALTERYVNEVWRRYNEGLLGISERARGVVVAKGCGHFVQRDGPELVAAWVFEMVRELEG